MANLAAPVSRLNKRRIACVLLACGFIVLIVAVFFGWHNYFDLGASKKQMNAAKKYMDSLTDKDIQGWIHRTQIILKEDDPKDCTTKVAPSELQQLGITGIREQSNEVDYVWFGGMDDTALDLELMSNGDFQVFAVYTPYSNRIIWPKR